MPETVPVRKVNGLPRASFSRNLAIQALPLAMCLAPPPALRDFHPIESAHAERTNRVGEAFTYPSHTAARTGLVGQVTLVFQRFLNVLTSKTSQP